MSNLDALVGKTYAVDSSYFGVNVLADTTTGVYPNTSLSSITVRELDVAGSGTSRGLGEQLKVLSVNDSTNQISFDATVLPSGDIGLINLYATGYDPSSGALFISAGQSSLILNLGAPALAQLDNISGVLGGNITPGTTVVFQGLTSSTVVNTGPTPTPTPTGTSPGTPTPITPANTSAVYRFFDKIDGTHFFTASSSERDNIVANRSDMVEETNGFGAVTSDTAGAVAVYRFFDTVHGTHFFTSSASERDTVQMTRSDLTYEPTATFYELSANAGNDVAVYRLFDSKLGTHFYTGDANEYAGITTPGSASYRTDLKPEGVSFYAPAGSFS